MIPYIEAAKYCECGCGQVVARRFFSGHQNHVRSTRRELNGHWKGGRYVNDSGYAMVYDPEHRRASANGYVREHIALAEKALGKPIPDGAQVHHLTHISDNSSIVLCQDQKYHFLLHMRERAYKECGNPSWRKCKFCQKYDAPENLHMKQIKNYGWNIHHQSCEAEYEKKRTVKRAAKRLSARSH